MACRRLTFTNQRVFEIVIESTQVQGEIPIHVYRGMVYRVRDDVREHQPLMRSDGQPIQIVAMDDAMVVDIATHVLSEVTGSVVAVMGNCGQRSCLPPSPSHAG